MAKKVKSKTTNEESQNTDTNEVSTGEEKIFDQTSTKQRNRKRIKQVNFTEDTVEYSQEDIPSVPKKKKKPSKNEEVIIKPGIPTKEELAECNKPENKKSDNSKRQQKKEKYTKLLEKQKLDSQINAQTKNLNYLSSWKHNRTQWKFEKIKQHWLQKNMFDADLIPNEHWETLVEYFSCSKGHVRQVILKECMEVVDKYETLTAENENQTEIPETRFKRARDMLQSLEE